MSATDLIKVVEHTCPSLELVFVIVSSRIPEDRPCVCCMGLLGDSSSVHPSLLNTRRS